MEALRVSRQNPFSKLKRSNTRKALTEMKELASAKEDLPKLEAWLEKKQSSMPYQWQVLACIPWLLLLSVCLQKRWVVVNGSYVLWSDIQRNIKDAKSVSDRKKFNNSINILAITLIEPVTKGKSQRKFVMHVGKKEDKNKHKDYVWRWCVHTFVFSFCCMFQKSKLFKAQRGVIGTFGWNHWIDTLHMWSLWLHIWVQSDNCACIYFISFNVFLCCVCLFFSSRSLCLLHFIVASWQLILSYPTWLLTNW